MKELRVNICWSNISQKQFIIVTITPKMGSLWPQNYAGSKKLNSANGLHHASIPGPDRK